MNTACNNADDMRIDKFVWKGKVSYKKQLDYKMRKGISLKRRAYPQRIEYVPS